MMNKNNFDNDLNGEIEVTNFLEKFFYTRDEVKDFHRYESIYEQFMGKDVRFSFGELKDIVVDEKAQLYYVNKDLPTFAFELEYLSRKKELKTGWLIDKDKITDYYLLIWISADESKYKESEKLRCEDITSLDCIIINRYMLLNHLLSNNLYLRHVPDICTQIRNGNISGKQNALDDENYYFHWNNTLPESSINIIIYKNKLKDLADVHFTIERDESRLQIHKSTSFQTLHEMVTSI